MRKKEKEYADELRKRAEAKNEKAEAKGDSHLFPANVQAIVHELRTHQIELELQNEDLRLAHEELEISRNKYLDLYDFSPVGYISVNVKGMISEVNLTAARMLGVERAHLIKHPLSAFVSDEDQDDYYRYRKQLLKTHDKQVCELKLKRAESDDFDAKLESVVVADEQNKSESIRISFSDISDLKKMERAVEKSQRLESLGQLAGGLAHDFNNHLTGVVGNLSLAMLDSKDPKLNDTLEDCMNAAKGATILANELLTFAKGGVPVKNVFNIADLVKETSRFSLRGANVKCSFDIQDDLHAIDADPSQIRQVIGNLIINAKQSMPDGGEIKVSVREVSKAQVKTLPLQEDQQYLEIVVRDSGIGIEPKNLEKIFEPYFTSKQKGSGLGLATAFSIINNHNGYITVTSELGVGSSFYIYLEASSEKIDSSVIKEGDKKKLAGHVLIMDDEEVVRQVGSSILEHLGCTVETAIDGDEAIKLYKKNSKSKNKFDAVIMDLTIPGGMGGVEACREILKFDSNAKIMVSSGYSDDPVLANFKTYGFQGEIKKPYTIDDFTKVIADVLDK